MIMMRFRCQGTADINVTQWRSNESVNKSLLLKTYVPFLFLPQRHSSDSASSHPLCIVAPSTPFIYAKKYSIEQTDRSRSVRSNLCPLSAAAMAIRPPPLLSNSPTHPHPSTRCPLCARVAQSHPTKQSYEQNNSPPSLACPSMPLSPCR